MKSNTIFSIITAAGMLLISAWVQAQQPLETKQFFDNIGLLNQAWYPSDHSPSLNSQVRKKWVGIDDAPSTYTLNGHMPFMNIGAATGLQLSFDRFGPEKVMNLSTFFAKSVRLSESGEYLSAAINVGISRYEARYSYLDVLDPVFRNDVMETTGTIGVSLMFYIPDRFFAGFSVPRLSLQELGVANRAQDHSFSTPYYLMMGYLGQLNDVLMIRPMAMTTSMKGLQTAIDFSTTLYMAETLGLGLSYGTSKELGAHLSVYATPQLRLGYGYQFGTQSYGSSNIGNNTHEIGIGYRFGNNLKKKWL